MTCRPVDREAGDLRVAGRLGQLSRSIALGRVSLVTPAPNTVASLCTRTGLTSWSSSRMSSKSSYRARVGVMVSPRSSTGAAGSRNSSSQRAMPVARYPALMPRSSAARGPCGGWPASAGSRRPARRGRLNSLVSRIEPGPRRTGRQRLRVGAGPGPAWPPGGPCSTAGVPAAEIRQRRDPPPLGGGDEGEPPACPEFSVMPRPPRGERRDPAIVFPGRAGLSVLPFRSLRRSPCHRWCISAPGAACREKIMLYPGGFFRSLQRLPPLRRGGAGGRRAAPLGSASPALDGRCRRRAGCGCSAVGVAAGVRRRTGQCLGPGMRAG